MNKAELINTVADRTGLSRKDAEKAVSATFEIITGALAQEDRVQLVGFGAFETKTRPARIGHNPKTMESIDIPASTVPVFKAGKMLRDAVAK